MLWIGDIRFEHRVADPYLYFLISKEGGPVYIVLCVDNCFILGEENAIDHVIENIKKMFNVIVKENTEDYLSCKIIHNPKDKR